MLVDTLLVARDIERLSPVLDGWIPQYIVYDTHCILTVNLKIEDSVDVDTIMIGSLLVDLTDDGRLATIEFPIDIKEWSEENVRLEAAEWSRCRFVAVDLDEPDDVRLVRCGNDFGVVVGKENTLLRLADNVIVGIGDDGAVRSMWFTNAEVIDRSKG